MTPAELAIRALRRGDPVRVGALTVTAVETAAPIAAPLLITPARAAALKLGNRREAAGAGAVLLAPVAHPREVADPTRDLASPMKGPFATLALTHPADAAAALKLARLAGLLPALFVLAQPHATIALEAADIDAFDSSETLAEVARARLPIAAGGGELIAFRATTGGPEHLALLIGQPELARPVLTRLHSSCLTGDVLGSLRCDCGPQLAAALARLGETGGVLIYLNQEGRGIGLVNKLRAYALQDQGYDTFAANARLGLPEDARDFGLAAAMLRTLGVGAVRLLTNNPAKVTALEAAGVRVTERVPLTEGAGADNAAYLATKRAAGHML